MPIPSAVSIELTDDERAVLEGWTRRRTSAQALALRARIVLMAGQGIWSNGEIAEALAVSRPTVTKWRNRFAGLKAWRMSRGPGNRGLLPTSRSRPL